MNKLLRAAAAKVLITPEEKTGLAGFVPALYIAQPPEDVLDDLFARILMIDDGQQRSLFISVDCCRSNEEIIRVFDASGTPGQYRQSIEMFPYGTRQSWAKAAGAEESCVQVCATHTHAAPVHYSEKYVGRVREKIRELADQLVPIKLSISIGSSAISAHRRPTLFPNNDKPIDQTLYAIMLEKEDGTPLAGLVNYAVHPTILHPSNVQKANRVSTECVGMAMNELEAHIGGGFVSLFTQGFSGDVAPVLPGIGTLEDSYPNVKKAGHELFLDIARAIAEKREVAAAPMHTARRTVKIPTRGGYFKPFLDVTISGVSFGEVALLFAPGEIFNGYVAKIKGVTPFPYTIPVGLTNGHLGYFPTVEAYREAKGGYEMTVTPFDERVDNILTATAGEVLEELFRGEEA